MLSFVTRLRKMAQTRNSDFFTRAELLKIMQDCQIKAPDPLDFLQVRLEIALTYLGQFMTNH